MKYATLLITLLISSFSFGYDVIERQKFLNYTTKNCTRYADSLVKNKIQIQTVKPNRILNYRLVNIVSHESKILNYREVQLTVNFEVTEIKKIKQTSGYYMTDSVNSFSAKANVFFWKNSCKLSRMVEYVGIQ